MRVSRISKNSKVLRPRKVKLEASTACQLRCPTCPNASGKIQENLGTGFLRFTDFRKFIDEHPFVSQIELSNWGEIFLNKDLPEILRYAYEKNVALSALNGTNLNDVSEEVLEMLVRYRFRTISCSIDGATQETYDLYRRNGIFSKVIDNIKKINRFKARYHVRYPVLSWQFIIFGHNEHEVQAARRLALDLNMNFSLKLSWDDLYGDDVFSSERDCELIRKETGLDVANRKDYRRKYGREYRLTGCCLEMWREPQINFDGRVFGCSVNYWNDYGNAFFEGLLPIFNSEKMRYAKYMLMGRQPPRNDIPCVRCTAYQTMQESGAWLSEQEVKMPYQPPRAAIMLQNKAPKVYCWTRRFVHRGSPEESPRFRLPKKIRGTIGGAINSLRSAVYSIEIPNKVDAKAGWTPTPFFNGRTRALRNLSCHVSHLAGGRFPHLPHEHREEEILLLLSGQVDLIFPDQKNGDGNVRHPLKAGELVYYPKYFAHTIQASGKDLSKYLMFKWEGHRVFRNPTLSFNTFGVSNFEKTSQEEKGFSFITLFEGKTSYLTKLHCHLSTLTPGGGYAPHVDPYDVVIVVLEGEVETLGERVGPHGVIFYADGEAHGIRNTGQGKAKYLVFEFHGRRRYFWRRLIRRLGKVRRRISK